MSTDPPAVGMANEDGPPIDTDPKTDGTNARRASGARRSRRKKEDDEPKPKKEKETKDKEKPARAPRRPREKSTTTAASRKKPKLEQLGDGTIAVSAPAPAPAPASVAAPAPTPAPVSNPSPPQAAPTPPHPTPVYSSPHPAGPASYPQPYPPRPQSQPPPPQASHRTSGQNFDPIRSAFDNPSPAPAHVPAYSPQGHIASPLNYRASASPAISSIIDPPAQASQPLYTPLQRSSSGHVSKVSSPAPPAMAPTPSHPSLAPSPMPASSPAHGAVHAPQPFPPSNHYPSYPPSEQRPLPSQPPQLELSPPVLQQHSQQQPAPIPPQAQTPAPVSTPPKQAPPATDAMDVDSKDSVAPSAKKDKTAGTAPSSKAPSPKPARAPKEAPQLPQGSGLITNALFGGVDDSSKSDTRSTPNIIVHVPLQKGNHIVNFAQLAEEQYGFAALHPRLAAHKERMARMAADTAALERNEKGAKGISAGESADEDLSLDVDRDSDVEGDVTMGGTGAGTNGATSEATEGKKKRRKKVEEYDREDPFVDDTELAWQEQAAASKDGFFVYSGPLVQEGEKVQVERADGTIKRGRGRGRGTGRGRSSLASSHPHVPIAAASNVPISQDTGLPLRGPGSRGGTSRRARGSKKADQGDKHGMERSGTAASGAHEGRGGRAGSSAGGSSRGGGASTRGGKAAAATAAATAPSSGPSSGPSSMMSMMDLAPAAPSTPTPNPNPSSNVAPDPVPGPSPLAGPELLMK
ncbi:hypothetical protein N7492_007791 [Penicillium capsulatum]|uniref:Hpc2-related domain-containing protein n=1 Tax=Penicillium capsulatum TaxID=69766 RepID=A0A9W9I1W1_9EURO|nr:hypothetical protein N7492_007791 [Penicillium capsulatum]KAJ6117622.1 hypothetical protein N7512_007347 [Penicillium capsulatum]